jgi:hypothetical protein
LPLRDTFQTKQCFDGAAATQFWCYRRGVDVDPNDVGQLADHLAEACSKALRKGLAIHRDEGADVTISYHNEVLVTVRPTGDIIKPEST